MLSFGEQVSVHLALSPIDMRKSIDGLVALVVDELEQSPQSGDVFVFYNKARDKLKLVYWDRNGFALHYKRLDKGRFRVERNQAGRLEITTQQLQWLLAGLEFQLMQQFNELNYTHYY
ncbi:MAG: IS66 family insertion sequence hypothetical protein [Gammaproteobacteria bacterium CG12_big_fil_rev_8_21_14_0_65_46_12]|nr:MAG: IS66 family insertion sequence hypothetical protein [Gammaproteobacteria bacterium CG12_big_fil_rev_8_21_14_0_65_46_12]PIR38157.1 MAG: IS66 family insertion sequence hypothetical protein [Alphaproteobacteria bacterium CG11_big_fil_rev_8_21_14_0_20_39_49]